MSLVYIKVVLTIANCLTNVIDYVNISIRMFNGHFLAKGNITRLLCVARSNDDEQI